MPIAKKSKTFKSNIELSGKRALTVVAALEAAGVPSTSLAAAALGEHRPQESNDTEEGRTANRRVRILVLPRIDEMPVLVDRLPE